MALDILHVTPFFDPAIQFGGPVTLLRDLLPMLAARGHRVRVATTDNGIGNALPRERWLERDGYQVWYGPTNWLHRRPPYWSPSLATLLRDAIPSADVVHVTVGLTLLNETVRKIARASRVPYVYSALGCMCPSRFRRLTKIVFRSLFERRIIREAAALHAMTRKEAADYRENGASDERIRVIPIGIAIGGLAEPIAGRAFREEFGIPQNAPLILFLGRLDRIKGIDLLLGAFSQVRRKIPDVRLCLVGPDFGYENAARKLADAAGIGDAVRFAGKIPGERKAAAFGAADVYALTSYSEGMPLSVVEAASFGVPIVVTEGCNIPEILDWDAGRQAAPNGDAIASALLEILQSETAARIRLGANARRMAEEKFSLERTAAELESLYESLSAKRILSQSGT